MAGSLRLTAYDPDWPRQFTALAERIRPALGMVLRDLEHVGSTSVPGLLAKPVIDLAAAVGSERDADACIAPLEALGWRYRGLNGDDPRRRYHVLEPGGVRAAQLHLYILPAQGWDDALAFRDALRADGALAASYAAEKRRVAELVAWDKTAYAIEKGRFVQEVLARIARAGAR